MTKNISLPSERFIVVDAPEVEGFECRFVYNHFVPDEKINDSGVIDRKIVADRNNESFDAETIDSANFNRFVPRYNRLSWVPFVVDTTLRHSGFTGKIKDNLKKIYSESLFISGRYSDLNFDSSLDGIRTKYFVDRLLEVTYGDEEEFDTQQSIMDKVKFAKKASSRDTTGEFIERSYQNFLDTGHWNIDEATLENITLANRETSYGKYTVQANNKFVSQLARATLDRSSNIATAASRRLQSRLEQIQGGSRAMQDSDVLQAENYDFDLSNIVSAEPIDSQFEPVAHVIGYIIEKTEVTSDGETIRHDPLIIESPTVGTIADLKVKYGSIYSYSIRSVVLAKFQAEDVEENEIIAATILISSKPSNPADVICEEYSPPPHPIDVEIRWDYKLRKPAITWNFPTNPQRDIKYFQVFRRRDISEPFSLVKMYDFDDSQVRSEMREAPSNHLVEVITTPNNRFIDYDFELGDRFIYAICSVDAHGYTSAYSTQFAVTFNRPKNKLEKELISRGGAPKPYPNLLLERDTFVDSIKTSGYSQVKVVFNPEYLSVYDRDGNDLEVTKAKEMDKYQLQLINIDLQEQKVLDIKLRDRRKSKNRRRYRRR